MGVGAGRDGVGRDIVIEIAVPQHPLHDVSDPACGVRPLPGRCQSVGVPLRCADELIEPVRGGGDGREHQALAVGLGHHERFRVAGREDLVSSAAHEGILGGIGREEHADVTVGAAVQHDEEAVGGRVDVYAHGVAARQRRGTARIEPHAHGLLVPRCRRGGGVGGRLQEHREKRQDHGDAFRPQRCGGVVVKGGVISPSPAAGY